MDTCYRVLTPAGSAAVAVIALEGPQAHAIVRRHFHRINGSPLGERLPHGFTYGRFGTDTADEIVLRIRNDQAFEIHTHGGHQVLTWVQQLLNEAGARETVPDPHDPWHLLPYARTTRTAAILLDQCHGAYARAVAAIANGDEQWRTVLQRNANVGRHLIEPWRLALAGLPNAGKSSLMNALAGFDRSIVSPIAGTTRDAVTVSLAFAGWPVDLIDTAGLREANEPLEREGILRTRAAVANADGCLWLADATAGPVDATAIAEQLALSPDKLRVVYNKCDLVAEVPTGWAISAKTGAGLGELITHLVRWLVPHEPRSGEPVPFTLAECDRWQR